MNFFVDRSVVTYCFNRAISPRLSVPSGATVTIQTHDARSGRLRVPDDVHATAPALGDPYPRTNPATGPILVEGVEPGDTLAVTIERIEVDPLGFIIARPEWGTVRGMAPGQVAKMLPVRDGWVYFDDLRLPIRPNVGVLATAPAGAAVSTLQMGRFGSRPSSRCSLVRA